MWYIYALIGIVVVVTVLVLTWLLREASRHQRRLSDRLDDFTGRIADRMEPPVPAPDTRSGSPLDALEGREAAGFALPNLDGDRVTLDAILVPGIPLLLVFVEPRCGPCYALLPDLGGWQRVYGDRLAIVLVSSGELDTNTAMIAEHGIARDSVLLQQERELADACGAAIAPAAMVIQADGRIGAGPRYGARAIRQLVADTLGLALPPAPVVERHTVTIGEAVPALRRPDIRGNLVDLAAPRGAPRLVVFWSPECGHCQGLLPSILATERRSSGPGMVIVSQGPIGLTEAVGFTSPVVFDDDGTIARTLGVEGTPSAVVIDGHGKVATHVFRGELRVRALLERITSLIAEAAPA